MEEYRTNKEFQIGFEQLMLDLQMKISKEINSFMFRKGESPTYIVVSPETFELLRINASQITDIRGSIAVFMGIKLIIDAEFALGEFRVM